MIYDDGRFRGEIAEAQLRMMPRANTSARSVRPVPIDANFERAALDAARTCWHCHMTFANVQQRDHHLHKAHPRLAPVES